MENDAVFEATHALRPRARRGRQGRRAAHRPPRRPRTTRRSYFQRLQERYARAAAALRGAAASGRAARRSTSWWRRSSPPHEQVPADWPVHGTTGYRFAKLVNGLFVDARGQGRASTASGAPSSRDEARRLRRRRSIDGKRAVMQQRARRRARRCSRIALLRIARADRRTRDFTLQRAAPGADRGDRARFPVYRTYVDERGASRRTAATSTGRSARARRRSRGRRRERVRFRAPRAARHAAAGAPARRCAERYRAFADALPAVHRAGRRQGRRGHGVLPLQPAGLAERGRRRSRPLRHQRAPPSTRASARPRARTGRTRCSRPPPTTTSAPRTCARASTCSPRCPPRGACWCGAGAGSTAAQQARPGGRGRAPSRNDEYLLYQTLLGTLPRGATRRRGARRRIASGSSAYMRQGGARGEGAHQLDQRQRRLRGGAARISSTACSRPASATCSWPTSWRQRALLRLVRGAQQRWR